MAEPIASRVAWQVMRTGARLLTRRNLDLTIEGLEHVPPQGPVLLAARHYHHLYDGCALATALDRPFHIIVGLDWIQHPVGRRVMDLACRTARWPVIVRSDSLARGAGADPTRLSQRRQAARRLLLHATRETVALLRAGQMVVVFPEGYPNIDPGYTPKTGDEFLPFQPGFLRFATLAEADGRTRVPIVPVGFAYERGERWRATLRFGAPLTPSRDGDHERVLAEVERRVRRLSSASGT